MVGMPIILILFGWSVEDLEVRASTHLVIAREEDLSTLLSKAMGPSLFTRPTNSGLTSKGNQSISHVLGDKGDWYIYSATQWYKNGWGLHFGSPVHVTTWCSYLLIPITVTAVIIFGLDS